MGFCEKYHKNTCHLIVCEMIKRKNPKEIFLFAHKNVGEYGNK
ncbi:hypothetical protein SA2149_07725 [Aggregatibacter actinomycetemcomitans serotype e str. SA2149]|nr:hypothetical protein SA2149_07725 [Aggregatibacter actinomycetemcomitans serotype e str. SA2149]KYK78071.1 hypothetical protein SC383S_09080 [Aggregatibacter actinomycetemcomitans SC383s]